MRAWLRRAAADDRGFSLIEMIVAMTVMSIVMGAALSGLLQIYSATNRTEAASFTRDQLVIAFRRVDKELRYASWVSVPGQVSGRWYLEYAVSTGCRQLQLKNGVLTLASWVPPATTPGKGTAIASGLALITGVDPFTRYKPGPRTDVVGMGADYEADYYQVRIRVNATATKSTVPLDVLFTAQNTDKDLADAQFNANPCKDGRPTT